MSGDTAGSPLLTLLRQATSAWHGRVEAHPLMEAFARGQPGRGDYAAYLAGLLPVYRALEAGLEALADASPLTALRVPALYRSRAIEADLATLGVPPSAAWTSRLSARIESWTREAPHCLAAPAYVRYLGDLSGGRVLRARFASALDVPAASLAFFDFGDGQAALRATWLATLASLRLERAHTEQIAAAAVLCFSDHEPLFDEMAAAARAAVFRVA